MSAYQAFIAVLPDGKEFVVHATYAVGAQDKTHRRAIELGYGADVWPSIRPEAHRLADDTNGATP